MISAHTLVWGAGLQANALARRSGSTLERGNRIPSKPDLSVTGHPEVFAVGDIAWITAPTKTVVNVRRKHKTETLPQLGGVALAVR